MANAQNADSFEITFRIEMYEKIPNQNTLKTIKKKHSRKEGGIKG